MANIYGQLKVAQLEQLASDPTGTGAVKSRMYFNTTTNTPRYHDGVSWGDMASGGGGDSNNYATGDDADFETLLGTGWSTYDDAAATPVAGLGGTVSLTSARTTSSTLHGGGSLLITPVAAAVGEGAAFSFILNRRDLASMMEVSFPYELGTFASYTTGDMTVWAVSASDSGYTTNLEVTQLAPHQIQKASGVEMFKGVFQSHASNLYYKILIHQATIATGYTLKIDDFYVGPQKSAPRGVPVTDWSSYTPTFTGFGTATSVETFWRRVGDEVEITGAFTCGTNTGAEARVSLPNNATSSGTDKIGSVRIAGWAGENAAITVTQNTLIEPSVGYITFGRSASSQNPLTKLLGTNFNNATKISFFAKVAVSGWSSSTIMSADAGDGRVVAAKAINTSTTIGLTDTTLTFASAEFDTLGDAMNAATGTYTVKVPGVYRAGGMYTTSNSAWTSGNNVDLSVYKNGSFHALLDRVNFWSSVTNRVMPQGYVLVNCIAGDTITLRANQNPSAAAFSTAGYSYFAVEKVQGSSAVAASESVAVSAGQTSAQLLEASGSGETIIFEVESDDSHGSYNAATGIFTALGSGRYRVYSQIMSASVAWAAGNFFGIYIRKNGTNVYVSSESVQTSVTMEFQTVVQGTLKLLAGDTINIHADHNRTGGDFSLSGDNRSNYLTIERVGNY